MTAKSFLKSRSFDDVDRQTVSRIFATPIALYPLSVCITIYFLDHHSKLRDRHLNLSGFWYS